MHHRFAAAGLLVLAATVGTAWADDGRGADSFDAHCAECHSVSSSLKNKKGPTLFGVVGRNAGAISNFNNYSDGLKQSGIVWTPDKLDAYITNPKAVIPDGKMKFKGMADASERQALIEFLSQQK